MRVAFDGRSLASPVLRGWDRYTVGLVGELVRRGVEVTLFHRCHAPPLQQHVSDLGCAVEGLTDHGGLYWEQVAVPRALKRGRFDLFHAPAEHGVPLFTSRPVVFTIHSATAHSYAALVSGGLLPGTIRDYLGYDAHPGRLTFSNVYWNRQVARADHVLTPSEFAKEEIVRFLPVPADRVTVTPLAAHPQFQRPPNTPEPRNRTLSRLAVRRPFLLYVGGYEPHKNVSGLLEAFTEVRKRRPNYDLVLVGTGAVPKTIRERAAALELEPGRNVHFLVDLTEELTDLYDAAALFVTLSWRETFCLPVLEAMTRGVPAVASEWGAAGEIVRHAGRLVDPRDPVKAGAAILDVLADPNLEGRRAAARRIASQYCWKRTADLTLGVYAAVQRA